MGDIGGDNSVFRSINGSLSLWYTNSTHQAWQTTPSAYNFGGDTGETSTGIADYWTPSHTVSLNQGPSMLYGLWNADPWASVASGDIHVAGSITPNYGFVFVSNTHPVDRPSERGRPGQHELAPNDEHRDVQHLPPAARRAVDDPVLGRGIRGGLRREARARDHRSTTSYALNLKAAPSAPLNAPLYAFSNAQAVNLAKHVTGSSAVPLMFSNLVVNMNFTFEHVNDYAYATFEVFNLQNVSSAFDVNNTYQGMDAPTENFVIYDFPASGSTGVLSTPPAVIGPRAYATSAINIFEDNHVLVTNQTTAGDGYNLQVELWNDWYASVSQIVSVYGSSGVFVGDSSQTLVTDVSASLGSDAVTDIGSTGTVGAELSANGAGSAVASALSDAGAGFYSIAATNGASGVVSGEDYGAGAAYDSYYYLAGTNGLLVDGAYAINGSVAVNASLSTNVLVTDVWAWEDSYGVRTDGSHGVYVWHVSARDGSIGVYLWHSTRVYVADVFALGNSVGVWVGNSNSVQVEWVHAGYHSVGVIVVNSTHVRISHVTAKHSSIAIEVL